MSDLSRMFKDVEKAVSDVWHSDAARVIVPAAIGFAVGGPLGAYAGVKGGAIYGAAMGAGWGLTSVQQKKAFERAEALQRTQIAAQYELAGQRGALTERQMEFQMGQRQIGMLAQLYMEQDREPRILTLPTSREPPGLVDRINLWIDQALRA